MGAASRIALVLGLLGVLAPGLSEAGRRPFLWAYDTEIVPEGDVELEQWLWARGRAPATASTPAKYWIWWSPVIGLSSQLELAFPFQIAATTSQNTNLNSFLVELRYRLLPRETQSAFQPLIRVAYKQGIDGSAASGAEVDLVASYELGARLHANLDLGGLFSVPALRGNFQTPASLLGTYDLGLAYSVPLPEKKPSADESHEKAAPGIETPAYESDMPTDKLQLSIELFGEMGLVNNGSQHHFVGPSVSWTHGRFWLTAGTLVGLTPLFPATPQFMPRLICGIAL